jgi:hypothetical protein
VATQGQSHQTTIRFSEDLWERLQRAAGELDMSAAQYIREATRARLDVPQPPQARMSKDDPAATPLSDETHAARSEAQERVQDSSALWEQGRQARLRATQLRDESVRQRERHGALSADGPEPRDVTAAAAKGA